MGDWKSKCNPAHRPPAAGENFQLSISNFQSIYPTFRQVGMKQLSKRFENLKIETFNEN